MKSRPLDVRVASYTVRLAEAVAPFRRDLEGIPAADPKPGRLLLAGRDGTRIFRAASAISGVAAQVAHPIDWAATLEVLGETAVDRILDLGPGHALADMARTALPSIRCYSADAFRSIDGLRGWLDCDGMTKGGEQ